MQDGSSLSTAKTLPPPADPLVGRVIAGKFLVNEWLGSGAMGIVYRATQLALERTVAIKVLHHEFAADAHFAERFAREAKAASRLDHPNSIHVFDFGQEPDGLLYLAMEFVEGFDLFEWLADHSPVAPRAIVDLLSQVLAALAVAHDMGVIHRDLKPENIMIVRGTSDEGREVDVVKVCDFGIAKILQPATEPSSAPTEPRRKRSSTGLIVGTPAYMSPEQARGEQLDARSDLYAVGIVLYELLTGNVPFEAETPLGFALKHVSEPPARPSARVASVDPELEAICLQALSKNPADRYQNAREMRLALQRFASKLAPLPLASSPEADSPPTPPPARHYDSSKPTLDGMSPVTPAPRVRRSNAWLALLLLPVLGLVAFARTHFFSPDGARASVEAKPITQPSAALAVASSAPARSEPVRSSTPTESSAIVTRRSVLGKRPRKAELLARTAGVPTTEADNVEAPTTTPPVVPEPPATPSSREPAPVEPTPPLAPLVVPALPTPAPPSYDLALARVSISPAKNVVGATSGSVTRAVSEAAGRITACYKSALPALGSSTEGTDVLHVETDGSGIITDARLSGPVRGSAAACIANAVQGHRVANVDTGNASADIPLSFRAH